jgi:hypothetical protein
MPNGAWIWKADGAGATDVEGEKGMLSDALKRAAVRWGVGRYLYEMNSPWVAIVQRGKSSYLADGVRKELDAVHEDFCMKAGWGLRAGRVAYSFANQVVKHFVTSADEAAALRERNAGMIGQLPVAMRRHLNETLDRIGASAKQRRQNNGFRQHQPRLHLAEARPDLLRPFAQVRHGRRYSVRCGVSLTNSLRGKQ